MSSISLKRIGEWGKAATALGIGAGDIAKAAAKAVHKEATYIAGEVRKEYRTGSFAPLSPFTLAARRLAGFGGTKPLNVTGQLKGAVVVYPPQLGPMEKFVGILRSATTKDGKSLYNIARIHEEGRTFVVVMTDKMRRYLFGVLFPAAGIALGSGKGPSHPSKGFIQITIPARPTIKPVFERELPKSEERMVATLTEEIGKLLK